MSTTIRAFMERLSYPAPRVAKPSFPHGRFGNGTGMESSSTRPLALVTGASSGIGRELAKQFACNGFHLIVAAEDDDIHSAASELHALGARANAVQVDLRTSDGVEELWRRAQAAGRPIEAGALHAGVGAGGPFAENDLEDEISIVDLNCRSTVHLAKYVVGDMTAR